MIQPKYSQRWTHRIPSQGLHRTSRKRSNQRRSGAACSSLTSDRFGVPGIPGGPVVHIWYTNNIYVYENIPWVILTSEDVYIDVFSLKMLHLFLVKMNKIITAPLGDRAKPTHCLLPGRFAISTDDCSKILDQRRYEGDILPSDTVDGRNPAPLRMMIIPLFIGF